MFISSYFFHSQSDILNNIDDFVSKVYSDEIANSHRDADWVEQSFPKEQRPSNFEDHYIKYLDMEVTFYENILKLNIHKYVPFNVYGIPSC